MVVADARSFSSTEWSRAALHAIATGGVDSVTVEGLARTLGVTKGSFYWHFADRTSLITEALELWERAATTEVIDTLSEIADPAARLRALFETAFGAVGQGSVDSALIARLDDPVVGPVVRRVSARRLDFLQATYRELGLTRAAAAGRARIAYSTYVGHLQVRRVLPDDRVLSKPSAAYRRQLMVTLMSGPPQST